MFRKLLNVGKGHAAEKSQGPLQAQKNLFHFNEIKSYGFSHLCCLSHSQSLSLLAVGNKHGLLRVFGSPTVEFSYQLESPSAIRQIEFIDCRLDQQQQQQSGKTNGKGQAGQADGQGGKDFSDAPKIVVLTEAGILYLFELKIIKQPYLADNTTQTEGAQNGSAQRAEEQPQASEPNQALEYTKLELVATLDHFIVRPDESAAVKKRRTTTFEVSGDGLTLFVGTEGGNLYLVPLSKFEPVQLQVQQVSQDPQASQAQEAPATEKAPLSPSPTADPEIKATIASDIDETVVNLNDGLNLDDTTEPFEFIKFDEDVSNYLSDDIKSKKQGAIESVKRHPSPGSKFILISYHRGLSVIYDLQAKSVNKYFYHNQVLECSCFVGQTGDFFYTSHNDGSYIKWDTRQGSQSKANEDFVGQLYGPYPCKPTPKIQAATGLVNDQLEDLVIFSGGMPRATYDDKNPVTIVHAEPDGKDTIKTVLDFTSKVLDFVVITRPRGQLGAGAKVTSAGGPGGKKNKHKQQQQQRTNPIAVALAILAEEEFVVIDLLNSESYLEFALPYLNCVQPSAITCNQHYSDIGDELYDQLLAYNKQQLKGKVSTNEWPITGGKVIEAPELKFRDLLLTGHEDGSVNFWDVSDLSMRHLLYLPTAKFFSIQDDDLLQIDGATEDERNKQLTEATADNNEQEAENTWPPLKRVGRFDPYTDDPRLAIRKIALCPRTGTLVAAGTGGQVLAFDLRNESATGCSALEAVDEIAIVQDPRFTWKGHKRLSVARGAAACLRQEPGYQLASYVQLTPPVAATSLDLRSDWCLYALGTQYGFVLYDYSNRHSVVTRCTLNVQDFALVSGDASALAMSRKKSFRKSLRESFRRLRRARSQRGAAGAGANQGSQATTGAHPIVTGAQPLATGAGQAPAKPAGFSRVTTGVRTLGGPGGAGGGGGGGGGGAGGAGAPSIGSSPDQMAAAAAAAALRNAYSNERQVETKVELSSIIRCIKLTSAVIASSSAAGFKPTLWVGTNAGLVLVYIVDLVAHDAGSSPQQGAAPPSAGANNNNNNNSNSTQNAPSADGASAATAEAADKEAEASGASEIQAAPQLTSARLAKEIQLKHRAPIIAIFTTPEEPSPEVVSTAPAAEPSADASAKSSPDKRAAGDSPDKSSSATVTPDTTTLDDRSTTPTPHKPPGPGLSVQPRVLICSEEQFKVFNLPNLKPFCKFKLTAHEGLRAKKISITQFVKPPSQLSGKQSTTRLSGVPLSKSLQSFATQTSPSASPAPAPAPENASSANSSAEPCDKANSATENNNSLSQLNNNHASKDLLNAKFGTTSIKCSPTSPQLATAPPADQLEEALSEPYMVCMSNQGDCAIYSVPDLKRQAQIQVCRREDVNGITSAMLTNYGEGFYLRSSSNFLRFSISTQRVLRVLSVV